MCSDRCRILILENQNEIGGAAREDRFPGWQNPILVPQGSIVHQQLPPALQPQQPVLGLFEELGVDLTAVQIPDSAAVPAAFWPGQGTGRWYTSIMNAPLDHTAKRDLAQFYEKAGAFYEAEDWKSRLAALDALTFKEYCLNQEAWHPGMFEALIPQLAGFFAFPDQVSAAAVYRQYAGGPRPIYYAPGGNANLLRHLLKALIPDILPEAAQWPHLIEPAVNRDRFDRKDQEIRIRLNALAVQSQHISHSRGKDGVKTVYFTNGRLYDVRSRHAILAGGGFTAKRIVKDLPTEQKDAFDSFCYAPVVWINVLLRDMKVVAEMPHSFISYLYGGECVMLTAFHRATRYGGKESRTGDKSTPVVLGLALAPRTPGLSPREQAEKARWELLDRPFDWYERLVRRDLARLFEAHGFDPRRDIAAMSVSRWGHHGYIFPEPGFLTDGRRERARRLFGRVAFAHTELDGFSHMMGAVAHGYRAASELLRLP
jgi:hypothetical protein